MVPDMKSVGRGAPRFRIRAQRNWNIGIEKRPEAGTSHRSTGDAGGGLIAVADYGASESLDRVHRGGMYAAHVERQIRL